MSISNRLFALCSLLAMLLLAGASTLQAQGVTTASMTGTVTGRNAGLEGARVTAVHQPSGTTYQGTTRSDGRFTIPGMRVGGPYTVTARIIGFAPESRTNVFLSLGTATQVSFNLSQTAVSIEGVSVTAQSGTISSTRTGAATAVSRDVLEKLPTISRTIGDFTRLTPQASGSSFAGQDNRLNNITIDGSYFNNSFGLAGQPGQRTGVAPIPLDAPVTIAVLPSSFIERA